MKNRKWMYMSVLGVLQMGIAIGCGGGSSDSNGNMSGGSQTGSSFAQNVQPIFNAKCTAGCHSGSSPQGDLDLSAGVSYANLVNKVVSSPCGASSPGAVRVKPGDPEGSMLWRKLANTGDKCFAAMPLGTSGLINVARSEFDSIQKWIEEGALNN